VLYAEDGACILATAWVSMMQHVRNACVEHGAEPGFAKFLKDYRPTSW
jgi:hypothetical protein